MILKIEILKYYMVALMKGNNGGSKWKVLKE